MGQHFFRWAVPTLTHLYFHHCQASFLFHLNQIINFVIYTTIPYLPPWATKFWSFASNLLFMANTAFMDSTKLIILNTSVAWGAFVSWYQRNHKNKTTIYTAHQRSLWSRMFIFVEKYDPVGRKAEWKKLRSVKTNEFNSVVCCISGCWNL